jgi:hypothetical protein
MMGFGDFTLFYTQNLKPIVPNRSSSKMPQFQVWDETPNLKHFIY